MESGWLLRLEILNKQPICSLTCICSTSVRGADEDRVLALLSSTRSISRSATVIFERGGTHPSVFTAAPNAWRELVRLCQDLLVRSRTQLMLPDISDDEGRNGRTDTHTHTHAPDRQTMHTQETYSFETVQMFYFSVCQECSALSDRGVLISEAGSALLWAGPLW